MLALQIYIVSLFFTTFFLFLSFLPYLFFSLSFPFICLKIDPQLFDNIDVDLQYFQELYPNLNNENTQQYFDISQFNDNYTKGDGDLNIFHINIRSLYSNLDDINSFLQLIKYKFNILCFTESWLSNATKDLVSFPGNKSFHQLRNNKRGGGISVFVSELYGCKKLSEACLTLDYIESLFLEIKYKNKCIILGVIYRPPTGNHHEFIEMFNHIMLYTKKNKCI